MHSACWRPSFDRSAARPQLRLTTLSATALTHVRVRCAGTRTAARQCRTSIRRAWSHDDRAIPCKRRRFVSPAPGRARSASCSLDACHIWWQHSSQRSHHTGSCLHLESRWLPLTSATAADQRHRSCLGGDNRHRSSATTHATATAAVLRLVCARQAACQAPKGHPRGLDAIASLLIALPTSSRQLECVARWYELLRHLLACLHDGTYRPCVLYYR